MEGGQFGAYRFRPMRLRDTWTVASWRYPGEYAFYDMSWIELLIIRLSIPLMRALNVGDCYAVDDTSGRLAGVFTYYRRDEDELEIGLAMRPNLTGHGYGLAFVRAGMAFARIRFAPKRFSLTVAEFNRRARTVYERAGFVALRTFSRNTHGKAIEYIGMGCMAESSQPEQENATLRASGDSVGEA